MNTLTLAETFYMNSRFGVETELPRAGTPLENPFVYDASARDIKAMAERGLVEITREHADASASDSIIRHLSFKRLR
jgi:hypothetical protein